MTSLKSLLNILQHNLFIYKNGEMPPFCTLSAIKKNRGHLYDDNDDVGWSDEIFMN